MRCSEPPARSASPKTKSAEALRAQKPCDKKFFRSLSASEGGFFKFFRSGPIISLYLYISMLNYWPQTCPNSRSGSELIFLCLYLLSCTSGDVLFRFAPGQSDPLKGPGHRPLD